LTLINADAEKRDRNNSDANRFKGKNPQQALAAGFQRHLPKPVDPETLVETIEQLLHQIDRIHLR
jgi:CheY-like chemotaxis protein